MLLRNAKPPPASTRTTIATGGALSDASSSSRSGRLSVPKDGVRKLEITVIDHPVYDGVVVQHLGRDGACARHTRDDDPVRAALDKKQNREAAAERLAQTNAMAAEILQKRLKAAGGAASSSRLGDDDDDPTRMTNDDYRAVLERQRKRLMDDDESSSSSNISVFDPFMSK